MLDLEDIVAPDARPVFEKPPATEQLSLALDRRITRLEAIENGVGVGVGIGLAVLYWLWWFANGVIQIWSCVIPLLVGVALTKLGFAIVEHKLEVRRKALEAPRLPEARLIADGASSPAPRSSTPSTPLIAPAPSPEPPRPGDEPRLLVK